MKSEDIAKIVGVSRSTVSRVINNYPDIPEETRQKVLKAIEENNYFPNASARKLAGMNSKTLGIFMIDVKEDEKPHHAKKKNENLLYNNTYFAPFTNAFIDQANKLGYYVLVSTVYSKEDFKMVQAAFYEKRIDAGVFVGSSEADYQSIFEIIDRKFVVAMVDVEERSMNEHKAIYVNVDNYKSAINVVDYFVGLGHKNIGIITGDLHKLSGIKRFEGFKDAMKKHNLTINDGTVSYGDFSEQSGYKSMKKFLALENTPTAVFCCNDTMAIGAYKAISEVGLKIPDDISIIGFDNIQQSGYMFPPLTTVHVSLTEVAECVTSLLLEAISKEKQITVQRFVDAEIVKRESCRRID